jgi:hypothetical protein
MRKAIAKNKGGRPEVKIDWDQVGEMLQAHCDGAGIAETMGMHPDTLYRRCKEDLGVPFSELAANKKAEGKNLLRMKQFETAMSGDRSMLIFLGKVLLGQKETAVSELTVNSPSFTGLEFFRKLSEGHEDDPGEDGH